MVKYSIGYNHDPAMIKLIEAAKEYLSGFYFPIPAEFMGSGRALKQGDNYNKEIDEIISMCDKCGVKSELLINPSCEGKKTCDKEQISKVVDYVSMLKEKGLKSVIVTNPIYIPELKKLGILVESSVNCYVKNVEQAMFLKDLGADVITIDRDINRDLKLIKEIKEKTGLKIKMLVNEGCLRNCPFRKIHFNMISHFCDTNEFDKRSCITLIKKNPSKLFSIPFVRPEDVNHYNGLVDYFKLATRTMATGKIALVLDAYINEKFDGDLLFLLSTKALFDYFTDVDNKVLSSSNFFEKMTSCGDKCSECDYCTKLLEKAASVVKTYEH
ncbi:U32 family peptidase [Candidatus Woesearchaeota archaeon]|nr:U32 family peptidase [Candidatus Woesearchaeota archaeon]